MAINSEYSVSIHILTLLAFEEEKWLSSPYIASSVGTNPVLIRRLLLRLNEAGLVVSLMGTRGGVKLAKSPSLISLSEVFRAVREVKIFALHDTSQPLCPVGGRIEKTLEKVFDQWEETLEGEMEKLSISDVLNGLSLSRLQNPKT